MTAQHQINSILTSPDSKDNQIKYLKHVIELMKKTPVVERNKKEKIKLLTQKKQSVKGESESKEKPISS